MKVNNVALGYCLALIKAEKRIYVKSDHISAQEMKAMRLLQCENLQRTVDHLLDEYDPATQVAVFPTGSDYYPQNYGWRSGNGRLSLTHALLYQ